MTDPATEQLELILRQCAQAAPHPWYPRAYAEAAGVPRDSLDPPLERLRLRGLIRLTEWQAGNGQGYVLTPEGEQVLRNPRLLAQVRAGHLPQGAAPEPPPERLPRWTVTTFDRGEVIREALLGPARPVVTYALIAVNVLVFLAALALAQRANPPVRAEDVLMGQGRPVQQILHQLGAVRGEDILQGQWWRLLACCFVHFGLLHLGVNMYSLYVIGPLLERMWGPVRFLLLYLIAGLAGSCIAMIFTPQALLAGASGALWGVMASMAVWVWLNRAFLPRQLVSTWMRQLVIVFVLNIGISFMPGISKEAHFGGGAVGAVAAVFLNWQRFGPRLARWAAVPVLALMPLLCLGALKEAPLFNSQWARMEMGSISNLEQEALDAVNATQTNRLLNRNPARRDPAEVRKAIDGLEQARAKLAQAVQQLRAAGPFRDPHEEAIRKAYIDYLEARAGLYESEEDALREKPGWTERALDEQRQRFVEAKGRLEELLQ